MNIWTRLGIAVALLGIFCIVCSELIERDGHYDSHRGEIAAELGGTGVLAFIIGRILNAKRKASRQKQVIATAREEEESEDAGEPFVLFNVAYWGAIFVLFGVVFPFIPANKSPAFVGARPVQPAPMSVPLTNTAKVEVKQTNQPAFPTVKLQGITQRGAKSSALINGRTYFVGERVGEARLVSIFEGSVVLELDGQVQAVTLHK